ncbi:hypothetical protein RRG08_043064 [Elysia crispata]|uniref:Uncharacterized protein n=1 Tax=Elysia crispata TaxID=231223 RepID=A0AAE1CPF9_9GAST|nr:hypothetical protein RRG08_043064 [Elysia crispata]
MTSFNVKIRNERLVFETLTPSWSLDENTTFNKTRDTFKYPEPLQKFCTYIALSPFFSLVRRRGEMTAIERMGQEALMTNTQTHTHTQCLEEAGTRWASLPAAYPPGVEGGLGVQVGVTFISQGAVPECQKRLEIGEETDRAMKREF